MKRGDIAASVARNTGSMLIAQIITWASSFVLMLFLPRYLGSAGYGRLYLAMSVAMMFQMLIEFGGPYLIAKEVSREPNSTPSLLANSIAIRAGLWVVSIVSMILLCLAAGYPAAVTVLILILGTSKLWEGAGRVLAGCFQGFEMMQYPARGAIVERLSVALCGVTALLLGAGPVTIAIIMASGSLLNAGVQLGYIPRLVPRIPAFRWEDCAGLIRAGFPYFLWSIFAVVYYRVDAVMLSLMAPESVVGWYGAAYRLFDVLMFLPSIFSTAVFPVLSRLWKDGPDSISATTRKSLEVILLAGIPISIGVYAGAEQIIGFLFGLKEYAPSVVLLRIFASGLLLVYIDFILISALVASDRHRQWSTAAFVAMLVNAVLNVLMIPYAQTALGNGGIGSAIATLMTELLVMCMALFLMPDGLLERADAGVSLKGIVAGAFMALSIYAMDFAGVPLLLRLAAGGAVYAFALLALKAVPESDRAIIRTLFSGTTLRHTFAADSGGQP